MATVTAAPARKAAAPAVPVKATPRPRRKELARLVRTGAVSLVLFGARGRWTLAAKTGAHCVPLRGGYRTMGDATADGMRRFGVKAVRIATTAE